MKTAEELVKEYPDETSKIYNKGFKAGGEHRTSSEPTINAFKKMEDKFDNFKDDIKREMADLKVILASLPKKIIDETDKKYACKETENEVKELKAEREKRSYEWLKHFITAISSAVIAFLASNYIG